MVDMDEWNPRKEGKKWFRLVPSQDIFKVAAGVIVKGFPKLRVHSTAGSMIPSDAPGLNGADPERDTWEPEYYKMVGKLGDK